MTNEELTQELAAKNLRLASENESGWTYTYITAEGERVTVWVTEVN